MFDCSSKFKGGFQLTLTAEALHHPPTHHLEVFLGPSSYYLVTFPNPLTCQPGETRQPLSTDPASARK